MLLDLPQELHGLGEEVEGVHDHDLGLSALEVAHAVEEVGDDDVSGDEGVGEDGVAVVFDGDFEGEHGLFFEVFEAHFFGLGDEGFLVEDFGLRGGVGHEEGGGAGGAEEGQGGLVGGGEGRGRVDGQGEGGDGGGVGFHGRLIGLSDGNEKQVWRLLVRWIRSGGWSSPC